MANEADPTSPWEIAAAWRRELPDVPTRSIPAVSAVKRVASVLRQTRERALQERDIDAATLDLLSTLRRAGDPYTLTTRELANRCLVTAGAISQRVARAERDGLVERRAASDRHVAIRLTIAGHTLVEESAAHVLEADEALVAVLDDTELSALEDLLIRWSEAIRP